MQSFALLYAVHMIMSHGSVNPQISYTSGGKKMMSILSSAFFGESPTYGINVHNGKNT